MDGALALFFWNFLKVEINQIPFCYILEKINKNYDWKKLFWYHDALKIYGAPKLCTFMYWNQRPDQYKIKILVFSIQYDF